MKKRRIIAITCIMLIAAGSAYYFGYYLPKDENSVIRVSGHIEVTEVDMSFRMPGHVAQLPVTEGNQVRKGEKLAQLEQEIIKARLDQVDAQLRDIQARKESLALAIQIREGVLTAEVRRASAGVSAADARYQSLRIGSRKEEIAEAAASRNRAKTEWENRDRDLQRMTALYERRIIPISQFDAARSSAESARAVFEAADERYKLVQSGPREESVLEGKANLSGSDAVLKAAQVGKREVEKLKLDLKALSAQEDQAKAALVAADTDLLNTTLFAPFDGFITVKDVEQGEYVQAGTPVVTLAELDEVWVKTYVPETQLGHIRLGQKADVISDSFSGKIYPGAVTYISPQAEFTPKNVQTKEERIKLVYRIKVTLKNPNQELKAGMPVDVIMR